MPDGAIRDILERSIDELPDELRTVFVACVVDGITPEQFAELSALTSETVNARLHNARNLNTRPAACCCSLFTATNRMLGRCASWVNHFQGWTRRAE